MAELLRREPAADRRELRRERLDRDLIIVGGGLAGTCAAITAARAGLTVALVQDRPVLGGNSSSEIRLWVLGATAHMSNCNRWAREGGVVNEILVENQFRNREGNPYIFDTILLELAAAEPNLTVLLNTAAWEVTKTDPATIASVTAFCSQNQTLYDLRAPLFVDASGDGLVAFLAGVPFRMGAESSAEFGEKFAPDEAYGALLGHSLYFYSKDVGHPVAFHPPAFALDDITRIPRYRSFNATTDGCRLWWIEWGGRGDTIHDTEAIKWELWRVVYGVWHHIKNSGQFPEAANLTLEWVGVIPGKRESRRFEGLYLLRQQDLIDQTDFPDVIGHGGWSIDLHPADGVYSPRPGCDQWHAKGIYGLPYRCLVPQAVDNLFLAGRIISASHVAFGSTRVMGTCAVGAQAVALAAALCRRNGLRPRDLVAPEKMAELQRELLRTGQHLPGRALDDPDDLARRATLTASSELLLDHLPADGGTVALDHARAMLLPLPAGPAPTVEVVLDVTAPTTLTAELRVSSKLGNFVPDHTLGSRTFDLPSGAGQRVALDFGATLPVAQYGFVCLAANEAVAVHTSARRLTGVLSLVHRRDQAPQRDIGVETFAMWTPERRPGGRNWALTLDPPLALFQPAHVTSGVTRPTTGPQAWLADWADERPALTLTWPSPVTVGRVELTFDTDWDHPLESVLMGHPEGAMPFCVKAWRLLAGERLLGEERANHQTRRTVRLAEPVTTTELRLEIGEVWGEVPAAVVEVRCYPA